MQQPNSSAELNQTEQQELLQLARLAIVSNLKNEPSPDYSGQSQNLLRLCGAFVSLHVSGELRGCVGYIRACYPLWHTVVEMAQHASSHDLRFPSLRSDELPLLEIEISVLTPLQKIRTIDQIIVGKHGLYVECGVRSGLLLPQVAVEQKWDRTRFLQNTCLKAGLEPDAWQKQGTELSIFSAQIFSDRSTISNQ